MTIFSINNFEVVNKIKRKKYIAAKSNDGYSMQFPVQDRLENDGLDYCQCVLSILKNITRRPK